MKKKTVYKVKCGSATYWISLAIREKVYVRRRGGEERAAAFKPSGRNSRS